MNQIDKDQSRYQATHHQLSAAPDSEFIHVSYSSTLAENNSSNAQHIMAHDCYREIFPDTRMASNAHAHWKTTKGGVMYATGSGGSVTGFGAGKMRPGFGGAIVIDDPAQGQRGWVGRDARRRDR